MARLILETWTQGVQQYHKLGKFPVTVGRALDNDIILSDRSVSPYHLEIQQEENDILVKNLSTENGSRYKKQDLGENSESVELPATIHLGHTKVRVLTSETPVEPTVIGGCTGLFCLFSSPLWAAALVLITISSFWLDSYLNSPVIRDIGYHVGQSFQAILIMVLFFLITAGISRLTTHRWILVPSIIVSSLLFLIPKLVEHLGHFLDYYFNTDSIRNFALDFNNFTLLPLLLTIFMVRVAHTKIIPAIGVALLVSSPLLFFQVKDFIRASTGSKFSHQPRYSKTLSAYDIRMNEAGSVDNFISKARNKITEQVKFDLKEYQKK